MSKKLFQIGQSKKSCATQSFGTHKVACGREAVNGRDYFKSLERELGVQHLDPDAVQELPPLEVKRGSVKSKLGGRIASDLEYLTPDEVAERKRLSEEFLKRPVERVPEEEADES